MSSHPTESAVQSYLRAVAVTAYETERVGPFQAGFHPRSDNPYLNYAIPDDDAHPAVDDVFALIEAYRRRGRRPRLEYAPAAARAVEAALMVGGFSVQGRLPLMACRPGDLRDQPEPLGVELVSPATDEELLAMIASQDEAYGEQRVLGPADAQRARRNLEAGGIAVLVRDAATGEGVGGGVCSLPVDGVTELAAVGVRAPYRRRGIAAALTVALARAAFSSGVRLVFLTPEQAPEERIYARAGFTVEGELLHMWR